MSDRPNIVIVVADAVRAQNVSAYGYPKATTPHIAEWAANGVRFEHAIAAAEQTLASTASLFTGVYPTTHQLRVTGEKLGDQWSTLAGALRRAGYSTHCLNCNNPYVSPFTDLTRDFNEYECAVPALRRWIAEVRGTRSAGNLARAEDAESDREAEILAGKVQVESDANAVGAGEAGGLSDWMRWAMSRFIDCGGARALGEARRIIHQRRGGPPRFVYAHLMETHALYLPPLGHWGRFLPNRRGRSVLGVNQHVLEYVTGKAKMDALDFQILEGLYNGALHYTDRLLGRFLRQLRKDGCLDNTIVVFIGDHGENFGDHGLLGHGQCVYDTVVRVPMVVWGPIVDRAQQGRTIDSVVQNVDLTVSCLDWAGVEQDPMRDQVEGHPLPIGRAATRTHAISESMRAFERRHIPFLRELGLLEVAMLGVRSSTHKLIWNAAGDTEELYDLRTDPGESTNLGGTEVAEYAELRSVMDRLRPKFQEAHAEQLRRLAEGGPTKLEADVEQRLRELGYL